MGIEHASGLGTEMELAVLTLSQEASGSAHHESHNHNVLWARILGTTQTTHKSNSAQMLTISPTIPKAPMLALHFDFA